MNELKTILGTNIPITTRGILYLCSFKDNKLTVMGERLYESSWDALQAYANIPNPESQLVSGKTFDDLIANMSKLHEDIYDVEWLKELSECL